MDTLLTREELANFLKEAGHEKVYMGLNGLNQESQMMSSWSFKELNWPRSWHTAPIVMSLSNWPCLPPP